MMRPTISLPLLFAILLPGLAGCGDSKPAAGGNVAMRDMEVVDGTANDSMADLDNATEDGTTLSNAGIPPTLGTHSTPIGNSVDADTAKTETGEPGGNTSTGQ